MNYEIVIDDGLAIAKEDSLGKLTDSQTWGIEAGGVDNKGLNESMQKDANGLETKLTQSPMDACNFRNEEGIQSVIENGPWMVNGKPMPVPLVLVAGSILQWHRRNRAIVVLLAINTKPFLMFSHTFSLRNTLLSTDLSLYFLHISSQPLVGAKAVIEVPGEGIGFWRLE
ncbi:hypothetical protein Tco_0713987 [Tanacetum coccineum]